MTVEEKIADLKANFDYVLEGKDLEIKELKDRLSEEVELHLHAEDYIKSLEQQIVDLKDFVLKVSKFLHNNNNVRPDKLVYKERDILLIKELKLFEKWELSK